jgi:hypothetical protein
MKITRIEQREVGKEGYIRPMKFLITAFLEYVIHVEIINEKRY